MNQRRQDRQRAQRREALARLLAAAAAGVPPEPGLLRRGETREDLFFHDHGELLAGFGEALERAGLLEASLAMARHLEEDRELWLARLALMDADPALRARRAQAAQEWRALLRAHFRRWGAAGTQGERVADLEAAIAQGALEGALRLWLEGQGRPVLPVLAEAALGVAWPSLYAHARRR